MSAEFAEFKRYAHILFTMTAITNQIYFCGKNTLEATTANISAAASDDCTLGYFGQG